MNHSLLQLWYLPQDGCGMVEAAGMCTFMRDLSAGFSGVNVPTEELGGQKDISELSLGQGRTMKMPVLLIGHQCIYCEPAIDDAG